MKLKYCVVALTTGATLGVCPAAHADEVFETSNQENLINSTITAATDDDNDGDVLDLGDGSNLKHLDEAVVMAVRAPKNSPFAVSNISRVELEDFARTGQELPFLFSRTPGVVAWSENGLGTGTTYMRMRGSGDSRINVTLDGVSLNSPEDQCVFWANMNSYAALLGDVQIQRGVGTSSNGDGAFGGTIAMKTKFPSFMPHLELSASGGSYNTWNYGGNFSTGLFGHSHFIIDGAFHATQTDGYIHGTKGNSGSYYGGITYLSHDSNFKLSYKNIGNYEHTGQAWNGIDTGDLLDWNYGGMGTGIFNYKDMYNAGLGQYNTLYEYLNDGGDPTKGTSRYELNDGTKWPRTTDNFLQNHNLLNAAWNVNDQWTLSATAHYTHGSGYYEEFRSQNKLSKFGLPTLTLADDSKMKKADFIRQKGLTQDAYGIVANTSYTSNKLDFIGGATVQEFVGNHWGYVTYMPDEVRAYLNTQKTNAYGDSVWGKGDHANDYKYYDSDASKFDASVFAKAIWHITESFDAFGDIQYRHVNYVTDGINDKFYDSMQNQRLDINESYDFLNPKVGLSYHQGGHRAYASYALSHREPERNNFTDNGKYPAPKPEALNDIELGYAFANSIFHVSLGAYAMLYNNQFVQTGEVSDIGEALTTNINKSQRLGLELSAGVNVTKWLSIEANAALSQNKIMDFDEVVEDWDDYDTGVKTIHYDNSTLAFSPSAVANGFIDFHMAGFKATWHTAFVSKQFLDNTACDDRSLPAFTRTDVALSYDLKVAQKGLKSIVFGVDLGNIFNAHYASNGWVYSAIYASGGNPNEKRYTEIGYIPSAGFTAMGSIKLKF